MIKLRAWQLILVRLIVIPVLIRIASIVEEKAKETKNDWDDIGAAVLKNAVEFLSAPEVFEQT